MQMTHSSSRVGRNHGFTLVELMIAIAISTILMLGVMQIFGVSKRTYRLDEGLARAQENARYAVHLLSEEIRMAGYVGCRASKIANVLNNTTSWMFDFDTPLQGWEGGVSTFPSEFASKVVPGTDALVVLRGDNTTYQVARDIWTSAVFQLNTVQGLYQNDIVMVSDCNQASIFQITNLQVSTVTITHQSGTGTPGNCSKNLGAPVSTPCTANSGPASNYGANSGLMKMRASAFYIGQSTSGTGHSLFRISMDKGGMLAPEELAEGVENMQILYGVDTNADGLAERYVTADQVTDFKTVVSVRLGLLVNTTTDVTSNTNSKSYTIAGTTITASGTDKKLRFPINTTIKLRNRGAM